ncbi:nuclear transport factor 2 family protein [Actinoplanes sp. NPDC000266]
MKSKDAARQADIEQIRDLKARYARLADAKRWADVAALFTDDAVMRFYDVDGVLTRQVTAATFAEVIGGSVGHGQPIHHLFSHEIAFTSDDEATAVWAMEDRIYHDRAAHPESPFTYLHGFGHYHERYRRENGAWRIAGFDQTRLRMEVVR